MFYLKGMHIANVMVCYAVSYMEYKRRVIIFYILYSSLIVMSSESHTYDDFLHNLFTFHSYVHQNYMKLIKPWHIWQCYNASVVNMEFKSNLSSKVLFMTVVQQGTHLLYHTNQGNVLKNKRTQRAQTSSAKADSYPHITYCIKGCQYDW